MKHPGRGRMHACKQCVFPPELVFRSPRIVYQQGNLGGLNVLRKSHPTVSDESDNHDE